MLEIDKKHENQLPQAREENHIDIVAVEHQRSGFLRLSSVLPTSRMFTSGYVNTETILHFFNITQAISSGRNCTSSYSWVNLTCYSAYLDLLYVDYDANLNFLQENVHH